MDKKSAYKLDLLLWVIYTGLTGKVGECPGLALTRQILWKVLRSYAINDLIMCYHVCMSCSMHKKQYGKILLNLIMFEIVYVKISLGLFFKFHLLNLGTHSFLYLTLSVLGGAGPCVTSEPTVRYPP